MVKSIIIITTIKFHTNYNDNFQYTLILTISDKLSCSYTYPNKDTDLYTKEQSRCTSNGP